MDLAIYINELLALEGAVNVPGVGYFAQKRINGYYSEHENKFYPPRHEVVFDPQSKDDDGLASYISAKKNISPASAKYFIDKYTAGIKQQAAEQKVDITGLGYLYYEYSTLTFKVDKAFEEKDPAFYGFVPLKAQKSSVGIVPKETAPQIEPLPEPVVIPPVVEAEDEERGEERSPRGAIAESRNYVQPLEYEDEPVESKGSIWVILLLIVIIGLLCFGVLYQYKPAWFGRKPVTDTTVIVKTEAPVSKTDTTASPAAKQDTTSVNASPAQAINPPLDTFATKHYDILGGAFKSLSKVTAAMKTDETLGLHPHLLKHGIGNYYKITLGTYFNKPDAQKAKDSILNIKGINKNFIYIQPYIPKK